MRRAALWAAAVVAAACLLALARMAPAQAPDAPPEITASAVVAGGWLTVTARATDDNGIVALTVSAPSCSATAQPRPPTPWAYVRARSTDERALVAQTATVTATDTAGHVVTQTVPVQR